MIMSWRASPVGRSGRPQLNELVDPGSDQHEGDDEHRPRRDRRPPTGRAIDTRHHAVEPPLLLPAEYDRQHHTQHPDADERDRCDKELIDPETEGPEDGGCRNDERDVL